VAKSIIRLQPKAVPGNSVALFVPGVLEKLCILGINQIVDIFLRE
jgi:hypothetical protein